MRGFPQNTLSISYMFESFLFNGFIGFLFIDLLKRNFSDYSESGSFIYNRAKQSHTLVLEKIQKRYLLMYS